jgi:hypothetical protein
MKNRSRIAAEQNTDLIFLQHDLPLKFGHGGFRGFRS